DRPVGGDDHVIGGVEPVAPEAVDDRLGGVHIGGADGAVALDRATAVRAFDDGAVQVQGAAVGEVDAGGEHREFAGVLRVLEDPVAGDVAEAHRPAARDPDRALGPGGAGGDPLEGRVAGQQRGGRGLVHG